MIAETDTLQDPVLAEMVRRLVGALAPVRIYLFGSRARNESSPQSDYDLMVVVQRSDLSVTARSQEAYLLLCGLAVGKDVIVLTQEEFDRKQDVAASLPASILREGRLLYAA